MLIVVCSKGQKRTDSLEVLLKEALSCKLATCHADVHRWHFSQPPRLRTLLLLAPITLLIPSRYRLHTLPIPWGAYTWPRMRPSWVPGDPALQWVARTCFLSAFVEARKRRETIVAFLGSGPGVWAICKIAAQSPDQTSGTCVFDCWRGDGKPILRQVLRCSDRELFLPIAGEERAFR